MWGMFVSRHFFGLRVPHLLRDDDDDDDDDDGGDDDT